MITFEMEMPNGALTRYHRIMKWEMTPEYTRAVVNSYSSEAMELISWQDEYTIPLEWKISTIDDIEFILTAPGAPMGGGTIVPDTVEDLMSAQARKWAMVKLHRDRLVNGTYETTFGPIQIDDKSILALATTRRILTVEGSTVAWTMADNASVSLTSPNIDTMLDEVVQFQTQAHAASQALRDLIESSESISEVGTIDVAGYLWPVPKVDTSSRPNVETETD